MLQADRQQPLRARGGIDHPVGFSDFDSDGLFDEHVGAGLQAVHGDRRVERVRGENRDRLRLCRFE